MPRGSKKKYTSKQKRRAHDIEKGYKKRGVSSKEAERRAWATVNKSDRGGRKKKAEEVGGRNEVNQVPAKGEGKVVEGRPAQSTRRSNVGLWIFSSPRTTLHLSDDAFVCSLLSLQQPNAIVESVAAPRASRVSTMTALMLTDGSRA
jgi:hypothetical protein